MEGFGKSKWKMKKVIQLVEEPDLELKPLTKRHIAIFRVCGRLWSQRNLLKKDRKRLKVWCPLHSWIGQPCSSLKPHGIGWEGNKRTKLAIKPSPKTKIWLGGNVEIRFPYLIFFLTNKRSFHCANCVVPVSAINRHFCALWEIVLIIRLPGTPLGIDHVTTIRPNLKCVVQTDPRSTMGFSDWTCNTQRLRLA